MLRVVGRYMDTILESKWYDWDNDSVKKDVLDSSKQEPRWICQSTDSKDRPAHCKDNKDL